MIQLEHILRGIHEALSHSPGERCFGVTGMKILDLQDGNIHLNARNELGYILNLQTKMPLDLQTRLINASSDSRGYMLILWRGVCMQRQVHCATHHLPATS